VTTTGDDTRPGWRRTRLGLTLANALLTGLFAFVFTWVWTDEQVDGSPYAIADPAGTAVEGAAAALVPTVVGLGLGLLLLVGIRAPWWRPMLLVVAAGGVGATLGVQARFPEGLLAPAAAIVLPLVLAAAVALVATARSLWRQERTAESRRRTV